MTDFFATLVELDSAPREPAVPAPYSAIIRRDVFYGCTPRTKAEYASDCRLRGDGETAIAAALDS